MGEYPNMEDNDAPLPEYIEEKRQEMLEKSSCVSCGEDDTSKLGLRPVHYSPGCKGFSNDINFDPYEVECEDCWDHYGSPENRMEVHAEEDGNIFVEYECGTVNEVELPDQEDVPYDAHELSDASAMNLLCLCGANMSRVVFPNDQELTL